MSQRCPRTSATKGAVEVLTRYLAEDLGARGIIVNTIAPGPTATDFSGGLGPTQELHGRQSLVPSG